MDVSCPQCETIYELDADQISGSSVSLKCSQCQHLFRFSVSEENQKRWMIRSAESGDVVYVSGLDSVYEKIMDRSIDRSDEISRTGDKWVTLEEIGEFTPVFQVLDSIASMLPKPPEESRSPEPAFTPETPPPPAHPSEPISEKRVKERERVSTHQQYADAPLSPESEPIVRGPLRARVDTDVTKRDRPPTKTPIGIDNTQSVEIPWGQKSEPQYDSNLKSSSGSKTGLFIVLALIALGIGTYFIVVSDTFKREPKVIAIGGEIQLGPVIKPASATIQQASAQAYEFAESQFVKKWDGIFVGSRQPISSAISAAEVEAQKAGEEEDVDLLLSKAQSALENSRVPIARRFFKKVLDKEPQNSEAITGMAWTHLEAGDTSTAASQFRKALKINPSFGDAYIGLGQANRQLGKYKDAYDAYDRYIGRYPRGSKASIARYQLTELEKLIGDKGE